MLSVSVVNMNALRAAVAPAVGPPHRDGRGPQRDVIGDYRTLERRHSAHKRPPREPRAQGGLSGIVTGAASASSVQTDPADQA
jgi:hypothetical protein